MRKGLTLLSTLALSVTLALPLAAEDTPLADTVVARVNGEEITLGHLIVIRAFLPEQYNNMPDDLLYEGILDQLIQQTALSQTFSGPVPKQIELALENERRSLLTREVVDSVAQSAVSELDIKAAYDAKYASGAQEEEYNASHILVETEEEALKVIESLNNGAEFAATAREKSTGPSGPSGGSLGWFGPGQMVPSFEEAVFDLQVKEISQPVETQFGWHIIQLNDKRIKSAPVFGDVRQALKDELTEIAVSETIQKVTSDAKIERLNVKGVEPSMLKDLTLLER